MEASRTSQVPGEPSCPYALFFDPGRTGHTRPIAVCRRGLRCVHDEGSRNRSTFEAQSHGLGTRCLRFARWVAPRRRKTRFRLLAKLYRTGLVTRRVPMKGFKVASYISSPFPKLSWRNVSSLLVLPKTELTPGCPRLFGAGIAVRRDGRSDAPTGLLGGHA